MAREESPEYLIYEYRRKMAEHFRTCQTKVELEDATRAIAERLKQCDFPSGSSYLILGTYSDRRILEVYRAGDSISFTEIVPLEINKLAWLPQAAPPKALDAEHSVNPDVKPVDLELDVRPVPNGTIGELMNSITGESDDSELVTAAADSNLVGVAVTEDDEVEF